MHHSGPFPLIFESPKQGFGGKNCQIYNTVHYNTVLDITQFKDGSQKCIDYNEKSP